VHFFCCLLAMPVIGYKENKDDDDDDDDDETS
jgi:hypothetical protein